jgi:hypothetical protein
MLIGVLVEHLVAIPGIDAALSCGVVVIRPNTLWSRRLVPRLM